MQWPQIDRNQVDTDLVWLEIAFKSAHKLCSRVLVLVVSWVQQLLCSYIINTYLEIPMQWPQLDPI
jgi:hypothetical protein